MTEPLVVTAEDYHQYRETLWWAWKNPVKDMEYITRLTDAITRYESTKLSKA